MKQDKFFRNLIVTIIVVLSFIVIYNVRSILAPTICALLLAYIFYPLMLKARKFNIPKWIFILLLFTLIMNILFYIVYKGLPTIKQDILTLTSVQSQKNKNNKAHLHKILTELSKKLHRAKIIKEKWDANKIIDTLRKSIRDKSSIILNKIGSTVKKLGEFLLIFIFVFVFSLIDGDKFYKSLISVIPNYCFEPGILILRRTNILFGSYLRALLIENLFLGILAFILLLISSLFVSLSMKLCLIIALIIAITNVIRIVGPIIGGAIGILLVMTSTVDLYAMGAVLIVVIIIQVLDSVLVLPLIMQDQINIHAIICLLGVFAGGILAGILGMILAVPTIGAIKVIYNVLNVEMKNFNMEV